MSTAIRTIIVNALEQAKLCSRNQSAPANLVETAFNLLKDRWNVYNNENLLSFLRDESTFQVTKIKTLFGSGITDSDGNITTAADVVINDLQNISKVYHQAVITSVDHWLPLNFIAYESFYDVGFANNVYSVLPIDESNVYLYVRKPIVNQQLKVLYTKNFNLDLNDSINLPKQWISLFTIGLVYDLSLAFPRIGSDISTLYLTRLKELEESVKAVNSVNKIVLREVDENPTLSYSEFVNGSFLM